jgi:hypothetical protein
MALVLLCEMRAVGDASPAAFSLFIPAGRDAPGGAVSPGPCRGLCWVYLRAGVTELSRVFNRTAL